MYGVFMLPPHAVSSVFNTAIFSIRELKDDCFLSILPVFLCLWRTILQLSYYLIMLRMLGSLRTRLFVLDHSPHLLL